MRIAFNPSTVAALTAPPDNKDITFDLRGQNIFARGVKFCGTDTNTWRDIKINNVSIGSNTLDLRDGDNTTLTNTNGVVTINSTQRPVVDNLTSDSTTSSLSANQGRILAELINGKSDSGHNHDDRYLKLTGGVLKGQIILPDIDVNTSYTGSIIIGASNTENLGIDGNEIMARNNGKASTLYLNNDGGAVQLGAILRTNSNIAYIGSQSTQNMIKFINNTSDPYGNGIAIGGGGLTIIGSGESSDVVMGQYSSGGDENMIIAGDGNIDFYSNLQDGWQYGKHMYLDTNGFLFTPSYINIGGNENNNSSPDRVWGSNGSDSYLRSYRTSALRVAHANTSGQNWDVTIQGQHWSRLFAGIPNILHHSSIFSISGSIGCVVFCQTFLVESSHPGNATIICLFSGSYTQPKMRALAKSDGTVLVDLFWSGNDCSQNSSTQQMTINVIANVLQGSISPITSLTNDDTIPSGYSNTCEFQCASKTSNFYDVSLHTLYANSITVNHGGSVGIYLYSSSGESSYSMQAKNGKRWVAGADTDRYFIWNDTVGYQFNITNSGNVGIGTIEPSYKLTVDGTLGVTSTASFGNNIYLPSIGISYIGKGLGNKSGADFTEANIVIRSWWGISFKSFDDIVRTYIDTRTGNIGTKGKFIGNLNGIADSAHKLNKWFDSRVTTLNHQFGDGALRIFHATSSVTDTTKCPLDAAVLHLAWDNNGGWDSQLAVSNILGRIYSRSQNNGTWSPWKTLAFTTDIPLSLKNPHSLTLKANGTTLATYDGSSVKEVNFTYTNIGAASTSHNHDNMYLKLTGGTMNDGARISVNGDLYIGDADNYGWLYFQDIASQDGAEYWSISTNGSAEFEDIITRSGINVGGQIYRGGISSSWVKGRDNALLRDTSSNGYHPLWSLKTTDGSWDFGEYNSSGWNNIPVLSYITDSNYNSGNNTPTYQIKFPLASGTIALISNILNPTNYYWANVNISSTANSMTQPQFYSVKAYQYSLTNANGSGSYNLAYLYDNIINIGSNSQIMHINASNILFYANSTQCIDINTQGHIGIGKTASQSAQLTVASITELTTLKLLVDGEFRQQPICVACGKVIDPISSTNINVSSSLNITATYTNNHYRINLANLRSYMISQNNIYAQITPITKYVSYRTEAIKDGSYIYLDVYCNARTSFYFCVWAY